MSVREYIGARYIPLFCGEWDSTKTYEPLSVVQYQGNSYTSRQYVPANVEITNEQYWYISGNYNAQVEQYRKEVAALDERIKKNATNIANETINRQNADTDITNVLNKIQPLDTAPTQGSTKGVTSGGMYTAIDNLNIPQMKTQITDLRELTYVDTSKIALIFGDSIARGYGTSNPGSTGWANRLANRLGITAYNFAVDGASFQHNIKDQVITAHNSTTFNDADVAYVFVSGGINDHGHEYSDIAKGLTSFFNNIQTYYPQAQVVFLPLLCAAKPLDSIDQGDQQYLHSYSGMYLLQICHTATWPNTCIISDGYTWLQGFPTAAADQVHPNDTGAQIIANNVYSLLRFGYLPPVLTVGSLNWDSDISKVLTSDSYNFWCQNDKLYKLNGKIKFSDVSNLAITQKLFTAPNAMWGRQNQTMIIPFVSTKEVFYVYLTNTIAHFWTLPTIANTDYYFSYFGLVGI